MIHYVLYHNRHLEQTYFVNGMSLVKSKEEASRFDNAEDAESAIKQYWGYVIERPAGYASTFRIASEDNIQQIFDEISIIRVIDS